MSRLTLADLTLHFSQPLLTSNYIIRHLIQGLLYLDFHSRRPGPSYPMSPWLNLDWAVWSDGEAQSIYPAWENPSDRHPCRSRTKPFWTGCPSPTPKALEKTNVGHEDKRWCIIHRDVFPSGLYVGNALNSETYDQIVSWSWAWPCLRRSAAGGWPRSEVSPLDSCYWWPRHGHRYEERQSFTHIQSHVLVRWHVLWNMHIWVCVLFMMKH